MMSRRLLLPLARYRYTSTAPSPLVAINRRRLSSSFQEYVNHLKNLKYNNSAGSEDSDDIDPESLQFREYAATLQSAHSYREEYIAKRKKLEQKSQEFVYTKPTSVLDGVVLGHGVASSLADENVKPIRLREVAQRVNSMLAGRVLFLKTIYAPRLAAVGSNILETLVEDENGDCVILTLHNCKPNLAQADEVLPEGQFLALVDPVLIHVNNDKSQPLMLRCDNPQCVFYFHSESAWRAAIEGKGEEASVEMASPSDLLSKGSKAFQNRRYHEALSFFERALKSPDTISKQEQLKCLLHSGEVCLKQERWEAAESFYQKALDLEEQNKAGLHGLVRAQLHIGKAQEAYELLQQTLPRNDSAETKRLVADCQRVLRDQAGPLDFRQLQKDMTGGKQELRGDYQSPKVSVGVEVLMPDGEGYYRGAKALADIDENEVLTMSKAIAITDIGGKPCSFDRISNNSQDDLIAAIIHKLAFRPELGRTLYNLEALQDNTPIQDTTRIDIPRLQLIAKTNGYQTNDESKAALVVWETRKREQMLGRSLTEQEAIALRCEVEPVHAKSGIWYKESLFNHSCSAVNCAWTNVGDRILIRSTRAIEKGEELTLNYGGHELEYEQRSEMFRNWVGPNIGFTCACFACCELRGNEELRKVEKVVRSAVSKINQTGQTPDSVLKPSSRKTMLEILMGFPPKIQHYSASLLHTIDAESFKQSGDDLSALHSYQMVAELNYEIRGNVGMGRLSDLWMVAGACWPVNKTEGAEQYLRKVWNSVEFSGFPSIPEKQAAFLNLTVMNSESFASMNHTFQNEEEMTQQYINNVRELAERFGQEERQQKQTQVEKRNAKQDTRNKKRNHRHRKKRNEK